MACDAASLARDSSHPEANLSFRNHRAVKGPSEHGNDQSEPNVRGWWVVGASVQARQGAVVGRSVRRTAVFVKMVKMSGAADSDNFETSSRRASNFGTGSSDTS